MQRISTKTRPVAAGRDDEQADSEAAQIDAWARHAAAANGFGDAAIGHIAPRQQTRVREVAARKDHEPDREPDRRGKTRRR